MFHEASDVVVVADEEKGDAVGEFERDTVFQGGADLPIIPLAVFEAKPCRQGGQSVQVAQQGVDGIVGFLAPIGGEVFESAVKTSLELVLHGYFISFLRCFRA